MVRVSCRFITLIEVLIVMLILGLVLGVIGINVNKAVHEQRFETEVGVVLDTLRVAQNIMLILDNDVHVTFKAEEGGVLLQIQPSCALPFNWSRLILTPKFLKTIHVVNFTDHQSEAPPPKGFSDIRFLSGGYVMGQGILRLATANDSGGLQGLESYICLPGYPSPLTAVTKRPDDKDCFALTEEASVYDATTSIVSEIKIIQASRKTEPAAEKETPPQEMPPEGKPDDEQQK